MSTARTCPICGVSQPKRFGDRDGVHFVRCGACAGIYPADPPDWDRIRKIYREDYHRLRGHSDNPAIDRVKRATVRAYLRRIGRHSPPGRRYLEVGCSTGAGLSAAVAAGWQAEGVELSATAAEIARARPGVQAVHTGRIEDAPLAEGEYDVVAMFDVIEHIDPPQATLALVRRLLRPEGLLLLVTPDAGSLSARWGRTRWPHLFVEHVVLFSRHGMRQVLEDAGFTVESLGFAWKHVNLEMLCAHAAIHRHVLFGSVLRTLGRVTPGPLARVTIPFNIGEFFVIARR